MSIHAQTAKAIRTELKKVFPSTKFSVTSQTYSGGNSVEVEWVDGPKYSEVSKVVCKYQYGKFNAMKDIYENTNSRSDIPQVKYVQIRRELSEQTMQECFLSLQNTHAHFDLVTSMDEANDQLMKHWSVWTAREFVYRELSRKKVGESPTLRTEQTKAL